MFVCSYCGVLKCHFTQYTRHLKLYHENKPGFIITCSFDGCKSSYTKVDSFTKHVSRHHKLYMTHSRSCALVDEKYDDNQIADVNQACAGGSEFADVSMQEQVLRESTCQSVTDMVGNMHKYFSSFILGLREKHSLPSLVQNQIIGNMQSVVSSALVDYSNVIMKKMQDSGPATVKALSPCSAQVLCCVKVSSNIGKNGNAIFILGN